MEVLRVHDEAVASASVPYHEFLLRYKSRALVVYGLVEGKQDPMFYKGVIESRLPAAWEVELIRAGNKAAVLKALEVFDWQRFSRRRICFFVDRDLDDFTSTAPPDRENLYITDAYSIENTVCSFGTFRRVVEEVLNISGLTDDECAELRTRFESNLAAFQEALVAVMVQILIWRRNGSRPKAENFEPRDMFFFAGGNLALRDQFLEEAGRISHVASALALTASDLESIKRTEEEFRACAGRENFIRGKYILWFFVEYCLELHRSVSKVFSRFSGSPKMHTTLGVANAMLLVGPRSRCPTSLEEFLKRTYLRFIGGEHLPG